MTNAKTAEPVFRTIEPKIPYFGSPVALIRPLNEDGSTDLAPISSFWTLGWTFLLGLLTETKAADNVRDRPERVIHFPSPVLSAKRVLPYVECPNHIFNSARGAERI
jgi:flavin reductase (DIM6/NTAB) family NADH-FMN oxidoreductase RutF